VSNTLIQKLWTKMRLIFSEQLNKNEIITFSKAKYQWCTIMSIKQQTIITIYPLLVNTAVNTPFSAATSPSKTCFRARCSALKHANACTFVRHTYRNSGSCRKDNKIPIITVVDRRSLLLIPCTCLSAAAGRHVHGIRSSELKRKFQEALPDSQIND